MDGCDPMVLDAMCSRVPKCIEKKITEKFIIPAGCWAGSSPSVGHTLCGAHGTYTPLIHTHRYVFHPPIGDDEFFGFRFHSTLPCHSLHTNAWKKSDPARSVWVLEGRGEYWGGVGLGVLREQKNSSRPFLTPYKRHCSDKVA